MGSLTRDVLAGFVDIFENPGPDAAQRAEQLTKLEEESDRQALEITDYLLKCSAGRLSDASMTRVTALLRVVAELEDICDCGSRLVMLAERKYRKRRELPAETMEEVRHFSDLLFRFMDFWFGFIGDTPYSRLEAGSLQRIFEAMADEPLELVLHVGDIKSSGEACSDAILASRLALEAQARAARLGHLRP